MKARFLGLLALVSALANAQPPSLRAWTHVIYLVGDERYLREGIDQSQVLFDQAVSAAKRDQKNNYVIYFDPRGRTGFLGRRHVRFDLYSQGRKKYALGWTRGELDSTDEQTFFELRKAVSEKLTPPADGFTSLFVYGEHLGIFSDFAFDRSPGERNPQGGQTNLSRLLTQLLGLSPNLHYDVAVFQMCFLNTTDFLQRVFTVSSQILIAPNQVSNLAWNLSAAYRNAGDPEEFAVKTKEENLSGSGKGEILQYRAREWGPVLASLASIETKLGKRIFQEPLQNPEWQESFLADYEGARFLNETNEILIPFRKLLDSYAGYPESESELQKIQHNLPNLEGSAELLSVIAPPKY